LTGIRVAVVIAVGVATIAAAVGAGGLGTYIFRGLRQNDNNLLLAGAISSAVLALLADFALGQIERIYALDARRDKTAQRKRKFVLVGAAGLILTIFTLPFLLNLKSETSNPAIANRTIRVGSKDFTESLILAKFWRRVWSSAESRSSGNSNSAETSRTTRSSRVGLMFIPNTPARLTRRF
jgi:osmoprotectant transport system permease protein